MKTNTFLVVSGAIVAVAAVASIVFKQPGGLLLGLYVISTLMLGRSIVAVVKKRRSNVQPGDLRVADMTLLGTFALFVALTGLREGCVPGLDPDFTLNHATTSLDNNTSTNTNATTTGPRTPLKSMKLTCVASSNSLGDVGKGFQRELHCGPMTTDDPEAVVDVELSARDAFCYFPLYASAHVNYHVRVQFSWKSATTTGGGSLEISGTATRAQLGFGSCHAFNASIGRVIAADAAEKINAFVTAN